jgi:hypothetical protein
MEEQTNHLNTLNDIRSLMEKSTKFISLSGLSGIFSGTFALIGAWVAKSYISTLTKDDYSKMMDGTLNHEFYLYFILIGGSVLTLSLGFGVYFTIRKARKNKVKVWDKTSQRLFINLALPLISGGLFCLILGYHGLIGLIAPVTLIFYGLALLNASKYTLDEIRYLGICEIILGLVASIFIGYSLLFWAIGFGILHIIYGSVMYFRYEK